LSGQPIPLYEGQALTETEKRMSLIGHLDELRSRAIRCFIATFVAMIAAYSCYDPWILDLIRGPLDSLAGRTENPFVFTNPLLRVLTSASGESERLSLDLHFIGPMEVFMIKLKASFFAGAILASPFIFHQVWQFVSGGLTRGERKAVRVFFPASLALFACGLLIAYFVMLPVVLYFLVVVTGSGLVPTLVLGKYASLVVLCCLAFGAVFEMPLVILFLTRFGLVSPGFLVRNRKYALLVMFILAAMLTPPDIITQAMMALPMLVLYEAGIWVSKWAWARRQKTLAE